MTLTTSSGVTLGRKEVRVGKEIPLVFRRDSLETLGIKGIKRHMKALGDIDRAESLGNGHADKLELIQASREPPGHAEGPLPL
jgi:hypothetical protein